MFFYVFLGFPAFFYVFLRFSAFLGVFCIFPRFLRFFCDFVLPNVFLADSVIITYLLLSHFWYFRFNKLSLKSKFRKIAKQIAKKTGTSRKKRCGARHVMSCERAAVRDNVL